MCQNLCNTPYTCVHTVQAGVLYLAGWLSRVVVWMRGQPNYIKEQGLPWPKCFKHAYLYAPTPRRKACSKFSWRLNLRRRQILLTHSPIQGGDEMRDCYRRIQFTSSRFRGLLERKMEVSLRQLLRNKFCANYQNLHLQIPMFVAWSHLTANDPVFQLMTNSHLLYCYTQDEICIVVGNFIRIVIF